jgi:hypothetical protein
MELDFISWMGGAIVSSLILAGALGWAILEESTQEDKTTITVDDDQKWAALLHNEQ